MVEQIITRIRAILSLDTPPQALRDVVEQALQQTHPPLRALELTDRFTPRVKTHLLNLHAELTSSGVDPWFEFHSASNDHIRGPCFPETTDSPSVREAKANRLRMEPTKVVLESLSFDEFESISKSILYLLGARGYKKTQRSKDQGIDFFGELFISDLERSTFPFFRFNDNLKVWLVGQAKHYVGGKVATPEIRNLVGSVNLARFKEYASTTELLSELPMRSCDPVFVLFFTTGTYTRDAVKLAFNSGVILKDVMDLSKLIADKGVGLNHIGQPTKDELLNWAQSI